MRSLTGMRTLADRHALERAAGGTRVEFQSSYGPPNAETPLYEYQMLAQNAYGASGYIGGPYGSANSTGGNAVIFGLIDRRLSVFTEARFKYRSLQDKHLFGDKSLARLEVPWPDGTTGDLLARAEQDVSLGGNFYVRDTGDQLERLRPDWVTIVSEIVETPTGQVRRVIGFWYQPVGDPNRDDDFYPVAEVAHWAPTPDPLNNFRGMSWLTPIIRELSGDIRMTEYREAFFKNAATPNLVIKYTTKMAPERITRLQNRLRERHTGPDGAYGTLVLDEGADLEVVGKDMAGSAFDALQAAGETRIAMAAGVPPIVAGLRQGMQASAIGEYQQALRAFADLKIRPNWRGICGALAKLVQVPPGAELWYDTSDVSALQAGEQDKASTISTLADTMSKWIMAGYEPDSVTAAAVAGDPSLLKHSGLVSVQMQKLEDKTVPSVPNPETPNGLQPPVSGQIPDQINGKTPVAAITAGG
jgi:hypothetical protein